MTGDHRKRAEVLFHRAADLERQERETYLDQACGDDAELRAEVDGLLHADDSDLGEFLRPLTPDESFAGAEVEPDEPARPEPESDGTIGHYRIERELGRGGMGRVYLAHDERLDRLVALKMLPPELSHDRRRASSLLREARTAARLNHPNIATVYEVDEIDAQVFLAMEYVEGRLLSDVVREDGPLPLVMLLDVAVQIAQGLTAAHDGDVVHRDLKLPNLMITDEGLVKILDFGVAKAMQVDVPLPPADSGRGANPKSRRDSDSKSSTVLGTPGYASPEQVSGGKVDTRSDLFSFGVVLYELATGQGPFRRQSPIDTMHAVVHEEPIAVPELVPEVPPALVEMLARLLAKDPDERIQTSAEVLAGLQELKQELEGPRQRWKLAIASLIAALIVLAVSFWMRDPPSPAEQRPERLAGYIGEGKIHEARGLLLALTEEWGAADPRLVEPREDLAQLTATTLAGDLKAEQQALMVGDLQRAIAHADSIQRLDDTSPEHEEAQALLHEMRELVQRTSSLDDQILTSLGSGQLDDAWSSILELEQLTYSGRPIRTAQERSVELRNRLRKQIHEHLGERPEAMQVVAPETITSFEKIADLLRRIDPEDPQLDAMKQWRSRIDTRIQLDALLREAEDVTTSARLDGILERMTRIGLGSEQATLVRRRRNTRRSQEGSYDRALLQFREASTEGLEECILDSERLLSELPNASAEAELEELKTVRDWLRGYKSSLDMVKTDPDRAQALARSLVIDLLPSSAKAAADRHLDSLAADIEIAHTRARVARLCGEVVTHCDLLRPQDANQALSALRAAATGNLADLEEIRQAIQRVEDLEKAEREWRELEDDYASFRELLGEADLIQAELLLGGLEIGWRRETDRMSRALEAADRAGVDERERFLHRRARLYLRLGDSAAALRDAEELTPSCEVFILRGSARLLSAELDRGALREALADATQAVELTSEEPDSRALYLRGVCRYRLVESARGKLLLSELTEEARSDLDEATRVLGFESADAQHRLAQILLLRGEMSASLEAASRALTSPITEDEILIVLGGHHAAVEGEAARFRRDLFLGRARLRVLTGGMLPEVIEDCTAAIELDEVHPFGYYLRGFANGERGNRKVAIRDLETARQLADRSSEQDWTVLREQVEEAIDKYDR